MRVYTYILTYLYLHFPECKNKFDFCTVHSLVEVSQSPDSTLHHNADLSRVKEMDGDRYLNDIWVEKMIQEIILKFRSMGRIMLETRGGRFMSANVADTKLP